MPLYHISLIHLYLLHCINHIPKCNSELVRVFMLLFILKLNIVCSFYKYYAKYSEVKGKYYILDTIYKYYSRK